MLSQAVSLFPPPASAFGEEAASVMAEGRVLDLRSDLLGPRPAGVAEAMTAAILRTPSLEPGEDADERALNAALADELGVEAVLLTPTCTMANQIAIRLHLPRGGALASAALAHVVTVEAHATALTGAATHALPTERGHLPPAAVRAFCAARAAEPTLVWLENTHMLSAGSVMPRGWQAEIGTAAREAGASVHLDGSRLWNAAVAQGASMAELTVGADTVAVSLNKAIGAPLGSVLAGRRDVIAEAVRWRDALGGQWRPIGVIAAAARAALVGWRDRLCADGDAARRLSAMVTARLGESAVRPTDSNLVFLNRPAGDAAAYVDALEKRGLRAIPIGAGAVRLAIHGGVRGDAVEQAASAAAQAAAELAG